MNVRLRLLAYVAAAGLVAMPAGRAAAACPDSFLHLPDALFVSSDPTTTITEDSTTVSYNRGQCRLSLYTATASAAEVYVRVVEALDVAGVAPGTIVHATLEYRLDGSCHQNCGASGCGVTFGGTLVVETDSIRASADILGPTPPTTQPLAQTLTLPITFTSGTPVDAQFVLAYATGPGQTDAGAIGAGKWSVTGLAAGVTAFSCNGTVPVHSSSWGALKAHYR
jgi:hypothetical protein